MRILLPLLAILTLHPSLASAEPFTGKLYEIGSQRQKLLYTLEITEKKDAGLLRKHAVFRTPDGKDAVVEDTTMRDLLVERYEMKNLLTKESGSVEASGGKLHFSYTQDGKTKTDQEDLPQNFIIGPSTIEFIQAHWKEISSGDTVSARFGALDRKETVGFKFFKDKDTEVQGRKAIVVKMKPTSFVIAAIVKPVLFTMDAQSGRLLELLGRTLPKIQDDRGKWKDLDADIVYSYAIPTPSKAKETVTH